MKTIRPVGDVSQLPQHTFGRGALTFWGMIGYMLAEAMTMILVSAAYVYIRQNYDEWPPRPWHAPSLLVPTINLLLLLASIAPAVWAARAARRHDRAGVTLWVGVQALAGVAYMILRYFDAQALNIRWDTNAYGSVAWAVVVTHAIVGVTDVLDTIGLWLLFLISEPEEKHFIDTCENSIFWYFVVLSWVPLYVLVYLYPRWTS
jgi:cytochrome c oxidase subunit III